MIGRCPKCGETIVVQETPPDICASVDVKCENCGSIVPVRIISNHLPLPKDAPQRPIKKVKTPKLSKTIKVKVVFAFERRGFKDEELFEKAFRALEANPEIFLNGSVAQAVIDEGVRQANDIRMANEDIRRDNLT